ncbi:MAG: hypothetical protein V3R96_07125, partial [Dehalococcoidales bacterium]
NNYNGYSVNQIETMMMKYFTSYTVEEKTDEEDMLAWAPLIENEAAGVQETILVLPVPKDTSQLHKFMHKVEKTLKANILEVVGSWEEVRIRLTPLTPSSQALMLIHLAMMPEVEEVAEKISVKTSGLGFFGKAKPEPLQELLVTLSAAGQPSPTANYGNQRLETSEFQSQGVAAMVN